MVAFGGDLCVLQEKKTKEMRLRCGSAGARLKLNKGETHKKTLCAVKMERGG